MKRYTCTCSSMATVKIYTYRSKVLCLRTIKTFGNYTVGLDSEKRLFSRKDAKRGKMMRKEDTEGNERGKDIFKTYRRRKYGILK